MKITNNSDIPMALAVWLMHDEYDYKSMQDYISATSLMKPLRMIILAKRAAKRDQTADLADYIPRALGHSLHDSIEKAWTRGHEVNLRKLGVPKDVIDRVRVNPTDEELRLTKDCIPVYVEQRALKKIGKWTIGGKFDMVAEGIVHDNKSTSAYSWVFGGRDDEHALQGSLYQWLNPEKITADFIRICYIFTDWQRFMAKSNPSYPQQRLAYKDIPLLGIPATEKWVENKLDLIEHHMETPEPRLPECTREELWMSDPKYKYYANAEKTDGRSTKNFTSLPEAKEFMASKGGKGKIITEQSEPKRCTYCDVFDDCTQKDKYFS